MGGWAENPILEKAEKFEKWFIASEALYEIKYTVLYTFVVAADADQWDIRYSEDAIAVTAPRLAFREPSIDTATIQVRAQGGWLIFNQKEKLEALRKNLSVHARENAGKYIDRPLMDLCRNSLKRFLERWLQRWGDNRDIVTIEFVQ